MPISFNDICIESRKRFGNSSNFVNLLMQISTEYINAPVSEINQLINQSLAEIADFSSADRAYVFRYDYEKEVCSITQWIGTASQR